MKLRWYRSGLKGFFIKEIMMDLFYDNNSLKEEIELKIKELLNMIINVELDQKIELINLIREKVHQISPMKTEPVDYVRWVKNPLVHANDYNPNSVAPTEMELLHHSILCDGYTQPIVAMLEENQSYEVIDGFHRHRVGKECI